MLFFYFLSYLPFPVLYLISDLLYFLSYHVVGYRKKIVRDNLIHAFPEKDSKAITQIEQGFYRYLCDLIVEDLKGLTISRDELLKRFKVDMDILEQYHQKGISFFIMTAHYGNWEWGLQAYSANSQLPLHAGYQRINNQVFNKLMLKIRSRFGAIMHERSDILRDLLRDKGAQMIFATMADQRPPENNTRYWTTLLGRDVAFFTGTETLAHKLNYGVVFCRLKKLKRGFYSSEYVKIDQPPFNSTPYFITESYVRLIEEEIRKDPSIYLWSHDRWKHQNPKSAH